MSATVGQRWRFKRDLTVYLAHHRCRLSQRFLADVFDLSRAAVWKLCQSPPKPPGVARDRPPGASLT